MSPSLTSPPSASTVDPRYAERRGQIEQYFDRTAAQAWARLAEIHARDPVDIILISGDLTDAGASTEWAAFFDTLAPYPQLAERILALPGNHDLNVVDRANPARLELPTSPLKRLRQLISRWLIAHERHAPQIRIDVITVIQGASGPPQVEHLIGVG